MLINIEYIDGRIANFKVIDIIQIHTVYINSFILISCKGLKLFFLKKLSMYAPGKRRYVILIFICSYHFQDDSVQSNKMYP